MGRVIIVSGDPNYLFVSHLLRCIYVRECLVHCELFCWPTLTIREIGGAASIPLSWRNLSLTIDFIVKRSLQGWGNCMLGWGEL